MNATAPELVRDELELLQSMVPLREAALLELGCGKAEFARRLAAHPGVASVAALEVDEVQHRANLASAAPPKLAFAYGGAEAIPFPDASFDGVVMMKSLHHVPVEAMDPAFREIRRVLKPGGWLYVSEPVYAGELNEIVRLFHDEGRVRAHAYAALRRAARAGVLALEEERAFSMPVHYRDYDDFHAKHVLPTHSQIRYPADVEAQVREKLARHMTPQGADFLRPMRVDLMRRPGEEGSAD